MYFDVDKSGRDETSYDDLLIPKEEILDVLKWSRRVITDMGGGSYFPASMPIPEAIKVLGVYSLDGEANAFSVEHDAGRYVLAINMGYRRLLDEVFLVMATVEHWVDRSDEVSLKTRVWAQVEICRIINRYMRGGIDLSCAVQGISGDPEKIKKSRFIYKQIVGYFVFCHEMAHICLGHCDSRRVNIVGYGAGNSVLESKWKKEYDADIFSTLQLFNKITSDANYFSGIIYARASLFLYFHVFDIFYRIYCRKTKIEYDSFYLTHPDPSGRSSLVGKVIDGVFECLLPEIGMNEKAIRDFQMAEKKLFNIAKSLCNFEINSLVEMAVDLPDS